MNHCDFDDEDRCTELGYFGPPIYSRSSLCGDCEEPLSVEDLKDGVDLCGRCGMSEDDIVASMERVDA